MLVVMILESSTKVTKIVAGEDGSWATGRLFEKIYNVFKLCVFLFVFKMCARRPCRPKFGKGTPCLRRSDVSMENNQSVGINSFPEIIFILDADFLITHNSLCWQYWNFEWPFWLLCSALCCLRVGKGMKNSIIPRVWPMSGVGKMHAKCYKSRWGWPSSGVGKKYEKYNKSRGDLSLV